MSNRRFAVVLSMVALLLGGFAVHAIYRGLDTVTDAYLPHILEACVDGDGASCYSYAGMQMSRERDMALAALEMCASDSKGESRFDCMYKLAMAHQTGRAGQRNFVLAYRWYSTLIEHRGPAALVEVARNRLRTVRLVMSSDQIAVAQAQTRSWLGLSVEPDIGPIPAVLGSRL
jgi:hypothetical protein